MHAEACTIFLFDEESEELVLRATEGLSQKCVGSIRLNIGEGLTGLAMKEKVPINISDPQKHPQFRFFAEINEERFKSILAVPILRGISRIGVITLHREKNEQFQKRDVQALSVIASQIATILESTSLFLLRDKTPVTRPKKLQIRDQQVVQGMSASEGFAMGEAYIFDRVRTFSLIENEDFEDRYSVDDFKLALAETEKQLTELQREVEEKLDDAASLIFASHLLILKDPVFIGEIVAGIEAGIPAPKALYLVASRYIGQWSQNSNPYVREKVRDLEDLVLRILSHFDNQSVGFGSVEGRIIISGELYPSDLLAISSENAQGIVMVHGGVTSHVAILARSLLIPMIIVDMPQLVDLDPGTLILLDADLGNIYINPHPDAVESFKARQRTQQHISAAKHEVKPETYTKDGVRIRLLANINLFGDLKHAIELNAEGVGLYRTEFPFLIRDDFPTEEEQFVIYRRIVEAVDGRELVFRTLDIGGDKVHAYYESYHEDNPFLGMRSIRFSLRNQDIFKQQIRAMLRAGSDGDIKIMFPMISSLDEFEEAKGILMGCRQELTEECVSLDKEIKIGMMVELPSLVEIIDELADSADFFSIGTNDFIQYMLGVDRTNEKVADFYLPHHPSILRSLKRIVDSVLSKGKEISICGAMGHQKRYISFLLGIGIRIFSMNPMYLPNIQNTLSELSVKESEQLAKTVLSSGSVKEIGELIQ